MLFEIGDIVGDEDGNTGMVVIAWNDGDSCALENDAAHPNPVKIGHWRWGDESPLRNTKDGKENEPDI